MLRYAAPGNQAEKIGRLSLVAPPLSPGQILSHGGYMKEGRGIPISIQVSPDIAAARGGNVIVSRCESRNTTTISRVLNGGHGSRSAAGRPCDNSIYRGIRRSTPDWRRRRRRRPEEEGVGTGAERRTGDDDPSIHSCGSFAGAVTQSADPSILPIATSAVRLHSKSQSLIFMGTARTPCWAGGVNPSGLVASVRSAGVTSHTQPWYGTQLLVMRSEYIALKFITCKVTITVWTWTLRVKFRWWFNLGPASTPSASEHPA
ncbi:hypothetical protein CMUS01_05646 [Colletotrichum musicola]|uniref:Uncharacterized protein n=1 Tax=Colletotrichum musicola TaxID=2175873 RepID=A0A8H6KR75_9PEZI|nr:hypothetical protein CMUS01_05646 [Colletotrichum musicola]